jgi:superfamily II DNA or RNA helicase
VDIQDPDLKLFVGMARTSRKTGIVTRSAAAARYDGHHTVLQKTYGALADLRKELAESKTAVAERTEVLNMFGACADSQRAWLLLEDYFEKLNLSRKDFVASEWWPKMTAVLGKARLEELALLFMRSNRSLPTELLSHANFDRFAEVEQAEKEQELVVALETWMFPPAPSHLDSPRATLRIVCSPVKDEKTPGLHEMAVQFFLFRPRTGEKQKTAAELVELTTRAAHEQELFAPADWEFIQWLAGDLAAGAGATEEFRLSGTNLLQWLVRWGDMNRLEIVNTPTFHHFHGQVAELKPHLDKNADGLAFTHHVVTASGTHDLDQAVFFSGKPTLALVGGAFHLLRKAPPSGFLGKWLEKGSLPVSRLSHRVLTRLRQTQPKNGVDWGQLCNTHSAVPQFMFELSDDTVRLRLLARSETDQTLWHWTGHEWQRDSAGHHKQGKPEILDDSRLEAATHWLRKLDWFTPEPGLWVGDANEDFLNVLAVAWPQRPAEAEYLGNESFRRLFLSPRQVKPMLVVKGSGIDWFSVSAEWEAEGMRLSPSDLHRLATATGRFVKLPDAGWVELDAGAVQAAHETFADLGIEGLMPNAQKVGMEQAAHLDDTALSKFGDSAQSKALRNSLANFKGVPDTGVPPSINAELRPYQRDGFNFLAHLSRHKLGGILADDMGLGKTLQTLIWLAWLHQESKKAHRPALVICPASVLHNWRREAEKFAPHLKVLVLQSGAARHNLRKQIPENDIIVTNYALLRRDLEWLQKFNFRAIILDEAQFIKNPGAQVTLSVKQLKGDQRLALTGTPLENRLTDLWSIADFVQPGYLGDQDHFAQTYDPKGTGEEAESTQRIARRRLAAKLRPIMLRRLKKQVAKDLPDRIEERRDCDLGEAQRKLYLAELRRSREQVMQTVQEKGLAKSKMHVLAALTRLRQICCHPTLVGNDSASGKTETLFELLEPLLADNQKVLVFSQFVQMLKLLETECGKRAIKTYILTGETKDRQEVVNAFQDEKDGAIFLLSLRAAGTGLNLTTASYVVLYDPWWNPAVEAQAIDRSHRIGQTRTVNAYRLIAPGTVEEKIWDLQQRKSQTIADVLGEEGFAKSLSQTDLEYLFSED